MMGAAKVNPWTDERTETLKQMWAKGFSATEIAMALNCGITRNACIGKVHRLKLAVRANPVTRSYSSKTREKPQGGSKLVKALKPVFTPPPPLKRAPGPVSHHLCQYPMNDWSAGMGHTAVFCHESTLEGSSYCPVHHAKCWITPIKTPRADWKTMRAAA